MRINKKAKYAVAYCAIATCLLNASTAYGSTQIFVDGYKLTDTVTKNDMTYVKLRELANYIGYSVEYDESNNTVNFYKKDGAKPVIKRDSSLYPIQVNEIDNEETRQIIKIYELSENDNPKEIPKESFEKNKYKYELVDITKSVTNGTDKKEHTETVKVGTNSQDINVILNELSETMEYTSEDGYEGILKLDISSIQSDIKGYDNQRYTMNETRTYPNLSSADTSLVPKTINVGGQILKLSKVDWQATNTETVNFEQLADKYTAVVVYTGTANRSSVAGYETTAVYKGEISKKVQGKVIYTAYFEGSEIEDTKELSAKELKQQLKEQKIRDKLNKEGGSINPIIPIGIVLGLSSIGGLLYLLLFRKNTTVFSMVDGKFQKIGKTKVEKKNLVMDLTPFTSKVTTPSFILVVDRFTAKGLVNKTVTINYGDSSFQHIVTLDEAHKNKNYQIEVDF